MSKPHALIVGGSLAGLLTAAMLRTVGWTVTVFERGNGNLAGRGTGLGTRGELFEVMRRAGVALDDTITVTTQSRVAIHRTGETICEVPIQAVSTAWDRIYIALKDALSPDSYRGGMRLERFEQSEDRVAAIFADGTRAEGDLLIGADGLRSTVRGQVLAAHEPQYVGYAAWRGLVDESDLPEQYRDLLFHHMVFGFPDGQTIMSVPVPEADASGSGQRRVQFSWFHTVDADTELPQLCTGSDGRHYGVSIPPPLIQPKFVDAMKIQAAERLAPAHTALVAACRQPLLQPIFDFESPHIVSGRVLLTGDAAFVARPHVGTGVTKAALDALEIAEAIATSSDLEQALARYNSTRVKFGRALVARGRYLGRQVTASGQDRQAERFLNEFGAAGIVNGKRMTAELHDAAN